LAVEAFIDSLHDPDFEVRVKDASPITLAGAFQAALRLEANKPVSRDTEKQLDSRVRNRPPRTDVEARRVDWEEETELIHRLKSIEQKLRESEVEAKRRSREEYDVRINRLEGQLQTVEMKNKLLESELGRNQYRRDESGSRVAQAEVRQSVQSAANTRWNTGEPQIVGSMLPPPVMEVKRELCAKCDSPSHTMSGCPLAYCGNCRTMGH